MDLQPSVFGEDAHEFNRCRFCAEPSDELLDLSTNHVAMRGILNIMEFLNIDFINFCSENMPRTSCETCYRTLTAYYNFIIRAKLSQALLGEFYGCDTTTDSKEGIILPIHIQVRQQIQNALRNSPSIVTNEEPKALLELSDISRTREANVWSEISNISFKDLKELTDSDYRHLDETVTHNNPIENTVFLETFTEIHSGHLNLPGTNNIPVDNTLKILQSGTISGCPNQTDTCKGDSDHDTNSPSKIMATNIEKDSKCEISSEITVKNLQEFTNSKSGHPDQSSRLNISIESSDDDTNSSSDSELESRSGTPSSGAMPVGSVNRQESPEPYQSIYFKSDVSESSSVTEDYITPLECVKTSWEPEINEMSAASTCAGVSVINSDADGAPKAQNESWASYPWACNHCNVKFDTMEEVREHSKQLHRMCYGFQCVDCNEQFNAFNSFVEHVRQHRDNLRKYCQYCNDRFESRTACERHALSHWTAAGGRICDMCGERCAGAGELATHRKLYKAFVLPKNFYRRKPRRVIPAHMYSGLKVDERVPVKNWDDYEWTCQDCGIRTPDIASLRAHARELHERCFAMKCVDCLAVYRNFPAFVTHVTAHRPNLRHYCPYCNIPFEKRKLVTSHVILHTKGQNTCDGCGEIFDDKLTLLQHLKRYVPKRQKNTVTVDDRTCEVCARVFKNIHLRRQHETIHDQNRKRDHICDTCGKAYYTERLLANHILIHMKRKEICKVCKSVFPTKLHLKRHVATHLEDRRFSCNRCDKTYRRKRDLKTHLEEHASGGDSKAYKCPLCDKTFKLQLYLTRHNMRVHTDLRPYSCERCDKTFAEWANCDKHMRRIHGVSLARTKLTSRGRIAINRQTGRPKKLETDETTEEWVREVVKPLRAGKKTS